MSDALLHGQLVKQRKRGKTRFAIMRMLWGKRCHLTARLKENGFSALIQTAFIEHINLTIRRGVASLMRKTWSLAQTPEHILLHCEWWRAYYHFVRPHESLALKVPGLGHYRQRTPAVAAGLVSGNWTVRDVLTKPLISPIKSPCLCGQGMLALGEARNINQKSWIVPLSGQIQAFTQKISPFRALLEGI